MHRINPSKAFRRPEENEREVIELLGFYHFPPIPYHSRFPIIAAPPVPLGAAMPPVPAGGRTSAIVVVVVGPASVVVVIRPASEVVLIRPASVVTVTVCVLVTVPGSMV